MKRSYNGEIQKSEPDIVIQHTVLNTVLNTVLKGKLKKIEIYIREQQSKEMLSCTESRRCYNRVSVAS